MSENIDASTVEPHRGRKVVVEELENGSWVARLLRCPYLTGKDQRSIARAVQLQERQDRFKHKVDRRQKERENAGN